jgi:hypothetical protein
MAIVSGSRYSDSVVDYFTKQEYGVATPVVIYKFDSLESVSFFTHIYGTGETLHALSQRYFRRPDLWWIIAEYNPEIPDFTNIAAGTIMRIPRV